MSEPTPEQLVALREAADALAKQPRKGKPRCFYCLAPATLLCDGKLGWRKMWSDIDRREIIDIGRDDCLVTCDRPLCEACATRGGVMFFCGEGPGAGMETVDYCRDCAGVRQSGLSPLLGDMKADLLQSRRQVRPSGKYDSLRDLAAPLRDLLDTLDPDGAA